MRQRIDEILKKHYKIIMFLRDVLLANNIFRILKKHILRTKTVQKYHEKLKLIKILKILSFSW